MALLRAVNVGGRNRISSAALRSACESAGGADVRTLLQSGNAVFRSGARPDRLARSLEQAIRDTAGIDVTVVVRTKEELAATAAANPFRAAARSDPSHLLLMFLEAEPDGDAAEALEGVVRSPEKARLAGRDLFLHYPEGVGTSKLTGTVLERKLGVKGTARNWNTVRKLLEMLGE